MGNSASSGNILGYASGTQPGLVSTTAQTFGGKKTLDGGALIKGDTSGVAIPAGYVGEVFGTLSSGTGGFTYFVETTTAITSSATNLASITLNKGNYFFSFYHQFQNPDASTRTVTYYIRIGGTNVTAGLLQDKTPNLMAGCFSLALPITISSDSTALAMFGTCASMSGAALNNRAMISGFRIG